MSGTTIETTNSSTVVSNKQFFASIKCFTAYHPSTLRQVFLSAGLPLNKITRLARCVNTARNHR